MIVYAIRIKPNDFLCFFWNNTNPMQKTHISVYVSITIQAPNHLSNSASHTIQQVGVRLPNILNGAACADASRDVGEVKLLVVSKTVPIPVLMELYDHGVREFGENREPELAEKAAAMPSSTLATSESQ